MKPTFKYCLNCWEKAERKHYYGYRFENFCPQCGFSWNVVNSWSTQMTYSKRMVLSPAEFKEYIIPFGTLAIFKELQL